MKKKTRTRHKDMNCHMPKSCCQNMSLFLDSLIFSNFHFPYSLDFSSTFNCFQAFCVCVCFFCLIQVLVRNILGILMVIWFLKRMAVYLLAMLIWLQMMIYKLVAERIFWFGYFYWITDELNVIFGADPNYREISHESRSEVVSFHMDDGGCLEL